MVITLLAMYSSIEVKTTMQFVVEGIKASKCNTDSPLRRCLCSLQR